MEPGSPDKVAQKGENGEKQQQQHQLQLIH